MQAQKPLKQKPLSMDPYQKSISAFRSTRQIESFEIYENSVKKIRGFNNDSFFNKRNEINE